MSLNFNWQDTMVSPEGTHHIFNSGEPAYDVRFYEVLSFHPPGVAAVEDDSGAFHINTTLQPLYSERYLRTFGYYNDLAGVKEEAGMFHIDLSGRGISNKRYVWTGNFQENLCSVESQEGFFHINTKGESLYSKRYLYAGDFRGGIAVVMHPDGLNSHIKSDGELLHGYRYLDLDVFHKGFARARDRNGWVHIARNGKPIYSERYAMIEPYYNGRARVMDHYGNYFLIDETGQRSSIFKNGEADEFEVLSSQMVGFWQTQTIRILVESKIMEQLPATASGLSQNCNLQLNFINRLLRAAGELGLAEQSEIGVWRATPKGEYLSESNWLSLTGAARMWSGDHYDIWKRRGAALDDSEITAAKGSYFENFSDEEMLKYQKAILSYARKDYREIVDYLAANISEFNSLKAVAGERIVEVGGGAGELTRNLRRLWPEAKFTLLETKNVIDSISVLNPELTEVELCAADMFENWNLSADRVVLARVLHDWSDKKALEILLRARAALTPHGHLHIFEMVLEENSFNGGLLDINMHLVTGGKERSPNEWRSLLLDGGFFIDSIIPLKPHLSLMMAKKFIIKDHLKEAIKRIKNRKPEDNAYLFLRHSVREDLYNSLPSREVPLTPGGVLLAHELGELFQEIKISSVCSSPVPRCVNTAQAVLAGANQSVEIEIEKALGGEGFLISDGKSASDYWKKIGLIETIAEYVVGKTDVPGFVSPSEMLQQCLAMLQSKREPEPGVHFLFTHDMFIAAVAALVFQKDADKMWPGFMDGFVVFEKDGRFTFLYNDLEVTRESHV